MQGVHCNAVTQPPKSTLLTAALMLHHAFPGQVREVAKSWPHSPDVHLVHLRNLELDCGFHIFMRALAKIQKQHSTCRVIIFSGNEVSYGQHPKDAKSWRGKMLQEVTLDPNRTHFTGKIPRAAYRKVLQVSAAYIYLTYPFVLSWPLLEALATGCRVIGSRTAPVEEVFRDGENGVLVYFFDIDGVTERTLVVFEGSGVNKIVFARGSGLI